MMKNYPYGGISNINLSLLFIDCKLNKIRKYVYVYNIYYLLINIFNI